MFFVLVFLLFFLYAVPPRRLRRRGANKAILLPEPKKKALVCACRCLILRFLATPRIKWPYLRFLATKPFFVAHFKSWQRLDIKDSNKTITLSWVCFCVLANSPEFPDSYKLTGHTTNKKVTMRTQNTTTTKQQQSRDTTTTRQQQADNKHDNKTLGHERTQAHCVKQPSKPLQRTATNQNDNHGRQRQRNSNKPTTNTATNPWA